MRPPKLHEIIRFVREFKAVHRRASKEQVEAAIESSFAISKDRAVYRLEDGAIRVSEARTGSFSNVVLSLSALQKHDHLPVVIIIVRPDSVEFLLANSTFLKKVSHSSHRLRVDNIRGSFLGHDILREFNGVRNSPENFDVLFSLHKDVTWEENLVRLVEANKAIVPTGAMFVPTKEEVDRILAAPQLARDLMSSVDYQEIARNLAAAVEVRSSDILLASGIDNVNLRGNSIEQIITEAANVHGLSDLHYSLASEVDLIVDVKTKLLNLTSSPKLYNIDKTLRFLASGRSAFSLLLVGIDTERRLVRSRLVPIFDRAIVRATRIQIHWAGRASRGVTQLTGDVARCFDDDFRPEIALQESDMLLRKFLDLAP